MTVQDVVELLEKPAKRIENTVDGIIFGDPKTKVKGIATTFTATFRVLRKSEDLGVNFLIAHEGPFYTHSEKPGALENDPVCTEKLRLIDESGIAIYRFHDYWHNYQPDGIMAGLIKSLNWQTYLDYHHRTATIFTLPSMTCAEIAEHVKSKLGLNSLRFVGDSAMVCRRVGMSVGYRGGGRMAIPLFERENLDLLIVGEGPEWETPEYVRDAADQGRQKALMVLGHAESEEPGMAYLAELLKSNLSSVPVHFISEKPLFQII